MATTKTANLPVKKLQDRLLNVAIWERTTKDGDTFYNVTFERRYNKDGEWSGTQSLNEDNLLDMAELLRDAYKEIKHLRSKARTGEAA